MGKKLTVKQEAFCVEYVANGGNGTQAYIKCFSTRTMKQKTVWEKSSILANKDNVRARIDEIRKKIEDESNVSAVWVRKKLISLVDRCMGDMEDFDATGAKGALDLLNRMQGYYEKDNTQGNKIIIVKTLDDFYEN